MKIFLSKCIEQKYLIILFYKRNSFTKNVGKHKENIMEKLECFLFLMQLNEPSAFIINLKKFNRRMIISDI